MTPDHAIVQELTQSIESLMAARRVIGFALQGMQPAAHIAHTVKQAYESTVPLNQDSLKILEALTALTQEQALNRTQLQEVFTLADKMVLASIQVLNDYKQGQQDQQQDNQRHGM